MMNELLKRRQLKRVQSLGIPHMMAVEIVETAMDITQGEDLEMYINYAISLQYGFGFGNQKYS